MSVPQLNAKVGTLRMVQKLLINVSQFFSFYKQAGYKQLSPDKICIFHLPFSFGSFFFSLSLSISIAHLNGEFLHSLRFGHI